jgi:hypothetical protein
MPHRTPSSSVISPSVRTSRTPGGTLYSCTIDAALMTTVTVHTAKCSECDDRNMDTMLRCPGCTWQICKPCHDRRDKNGRTLAHGGMMSPGGLGLGMGLGSGGTVRRTIAPMAGGMGTPPRMVLKKEDEKKGGEKMVDVDVETEFKTKGKGKGKPSSKKRSSKSKTKPATQDESSDDDFQPDPASPISHKRRRTAPTITDTPTATSARPYRTAPTPSAYVAPASPDSASDSSTALKATVGRRLLALNAQELQQAWNVDATPHLAPAAGSIEALLQAAGVNTPEHRYDQHLLARSEPVLQNRVARVPEAVRRMAEQKPRLTAVQKVEERNRLAIVRAQTKDDGRVDMRRKTDSAKEKVHEAAKVRTVREATYDETSKYRTDAISSDENNEMAHDIIGTARKWAMRTYDNLPAALQQGLERGLDLRLDCIDAAYTKQLLQAISECAARKLAEFATEGRGEARGASGAGRV